MKYRPSTEGKEIVKKDYRKNIIFSSDDFNDPGHLLQVATIPPDTRQRMHFHNEQTEVFYILEGEATITINETDYLARSGDAFTRGCGAVRLAMFTMCGTRQRKISSLWSLRSTCQAKEKILTGRSNISYDSNST
jgi:mannose-6-phosphate isomerase-like protein (cupin superfamily)